jgi:hypothetical protein
VRVLPSITFWHPASKEEFQLVSIFTKEDPKSQHAPASHDNLLICHS